MQPGLFGYPDPLLGLVVRQPYQAFDFMAVVPAEMAASAKTNQVVFLEQQIWMLFLRQYMMGLELFGSSAYFASSAFHAYLRR